MRLSFPSTLTRKKILTLFLLTLLRLPKTQAGIGFKNCLSDHGCANCYDSLLNFPFDRNNAIINDQILSLCYDNFNSSLFISSPLTCSYPNRKFYCNKIGQSIFCIASIASIASYCGGILGDNYVVNNNTIGTCKSDFETMEHYFIFDSLTLNISDKNYAS